MPGNYRAANQVQAGIALSGPQSQKFNRELYERNRFPSIFLYGWHRRAGIFAPGIEQYDDNCLPRYFCLHDEASPGLTEKARLRYANIPAPAADQIIGIDELQAAVFIPEYHRMRGGGREFANDVVILGRIQQFARSRAVETLALFSPVESTK